TPPGPGLPSLYYLSPMEGVTGERVTIGGYRLQTTSSVRFNGVEASFVVQSDYAVTATVPSGASSGPITITTTQGSDRSLATFYVVGGPPEILSVVPDSGKAGTVVRISGHHFTNATRVSFSPQAGIADFTVANDSMLVATVD